MSNPIALECTDLKKSYTEGPSKVDVLKGVSFQLLKGELVAIIGNSGSGKTTLLHMIGGLDIPTSGHVKVNSQDFSKLTDTQRGDVRNEHIGIVYQFHHLLAEFSALENVAMPLMLRKNESVKSARKRAQDLLIRVGLSHRLDHKPSELSGGERQRVAIARALVTEPTVVLADEPTGNLDIHTAKEIQGLIAELNRDLGISFLIVTHDLGLAGQVGRVLKMEDGLLTDNVEA
ncbi:lipoprotein releasing system, ATP-binding protein [Gammaproteobacteria bacterium 45_16_T64]|nr:lipoprotein releasing system, ATP-binding protein [Gammaproteobacteria bacterium 45_16_T64]